MSGNPVFEKQQGSTVFREQSIRNVYHGHEIVQRLTTSGWESDAGGHTFRGLGAHGEAIAWAQRNAPPVSEADSAAEQPGASPAANAIAGTVNDAIAGAVTATAQEIAAQMKAAIEADAASRGEKVVCQISVEPAAAELTLAATPGQLSSTTQDSLPESSSESK